jgi:DNA-directed RNA polymerase specialized sigma subunit
MLQRMTTMVAVARQEWADGYRRLERERERPVTYQRLHTQLEAITEHLRRRLGSAFTLEELATEYGRAEAWVQEAIAQLGPAERWPAGRATATDAAFHLYARGAQDYEP